MADLKVKNNPMPGFKKSRTSMGFRRSVQTERGYTSDNSPKAEKKLVGRKI